MSKKISSQQEIDTFLETPRIAVLIYGGPRPAPTGVPVWFHWDGQAVQMFAGRKSPKVKQLAKDPNISVLVTNKVGEPEAWMAFDGRVALSDFDAAEWGALLERVAPRYWDLTDAAYAKTIDDWRGAPEAFVSLQLIPDEIRFGS